jgi:hypothetical protein
MKRAIPLFFAAISSLSANVAFAQNTDVDRAKTFFNAGARAYDAGDFSTAIEAFEAAQKLAPRPAILFSIAQAHRRQYFLDGKPEHLRTAIQDYRGYVDATPPGQGRRADAAQALTDLVPIADKLAPDAGTKVAEVKHTKINVSSPQPGAQISCDNGKPTDPGAPLTLEVKPGSHSCKVTAAGFFEATREVIAVDGEFVPVEVLLTEQPAHLIVTNANGAEISIDGRTAGVASTSAISVTPGVHLVAVSRNGHNAYVREVEFSRGEEKKIDVDLRSSGQRKIARGAFVLGAAGVVAGGVFTVIALVEEGRAKSVLTKSGTQDLTADDQSTYDSARTARTTWTDAAIIGFGAGAAVAATGLILYVFDAPNITNPTAPPDSKPVPQQTMPRRNEPTEIGAAPIIAPGFIGGSFTARF